MSGQKYIEDFFTEDAKRKGYRARSVFKLQEIDEKYTIFKKKDAVLDLGAAPGSFLQYAGKKVGSKGSVIGLDLQFIEPLGYANIDVEQRDITELIKNPAAVQRYLPKGKTHFDVVVADLAPKTSGNKELDHYRSMELNETVFKIAETALRPGGFIVSKMFEGEETADFVRKHGKEFKKIKMFKPKASARSRNELFYVGKKK